MKKLLLTTCILIFAIFSFIVINIDYEDEYPELLVNSKHQSVDNQMKIKEENGGILAVHYPNLDNDLINQTLEKKSEEIMNTFTLSENQAVKIDYDYNQFPDGQVSYTFIITNNLNEQEIIETYFFDIDGSNYSQELFSSRLLQKISHDVRYKIQSESFMNDDVFSLEFYEKTAPVSSSYTKFAIDEKQLIVHIDENQFGTHCAINVTYELTSITNELLFNVGVIQSEETPLIEIPERYIDSNRPMVALTFDDGPRVKVTDQILNILNSYGQNASFFMLGSRIPSREWVVVDMINSGHDAMTHSYNHKNFNKLNKDDLNFQVNEPIKYIDDLTNGVYNANLIRPPYGKANDFVLDNTSLPFILWNIDPEDWRENDTTRTIEHILSNVEDGDIILLHDIYESNVEVVDAIVPKLIEMGFQIVSVSQMAEAKNIVLEPGKTYRSIK